MTKLDISSTAIEKAVDLARDFVDKLVMPAVEETGLLLKDQVAQLRFRNQVEILNRTREYCEKKNISPKKISLKLLCPLLEHASLEEDDFLQERWAILLGNLIDSEQNLQNHVFPSILSQISIDEFRVLERVAHSKWNRVSDAMAKLDELEKSWEQTLARSESEAVRLSGELNRLKSSNSESSATASNEERSLRIQIAQHERIKITLQSERETLIRTIEHPESIPDNELKGYEISNLTRLGVIKFSQETFAGKQQIEVPAKSERSSFSHRGGYEMQKSFKAEVDVKLRTFKAHLLTELGELFIKVCSDKES